MLIIIRVCMIIFIVLFPMTTSEAALPDQGSGLGRPMVSRKEGGQLTSLALHALTLQDETTNRQGPKASEKHGPCLALFI